MAPNGNSRTLFGHKIKSFKRESDDFLAISAPRDSTTANNGGAVYIYKNLKFW